MLLDLRLAGPSRDPHRPARQGVRLSRFGFFLFVGHWQGQAAGRSGTSRAGCGSTTTPSVLVPDGDTDGGRQARGRRGCSPVSSQAVRRLIFPVRPTNGVITIDRGPDSTLHDQCRFRSPRFQGPSWLERAVHWSDGQETGDQKKAIAPPSPGARSSGTGFG